MQQFHEFVMYWDHVIWYYINTAWHTPFLDTVIPFLRNQWTWTPLYLFLLIFMTYNFGKYGWLWCLGFIVAFAISDQVSAHLLKPIFHRIRPCNDPYLVGIVHTLVPCGAGYSFPSSHASNHFAVGIFSAVTLFKLRKWVLPVAIIWALSVSFAQVYVGVHYPLDVSVGGLLGATIGVAIGLLFNRYIGLTRRKKLH